MGKNVHLKSALIGGLVAALAVTATPVVAETAAALMLGQQNQSNVRTVLSGNPQTANLRLINGNADGTALSLFVEPGNSPLKVNSTRKVSKLNADRVDGFSAAQLVRVAHAESSNLPDVEGAVLSVEVKAPVDGFVFISGGLIESQAGSGTWFRCWFAVDGAEAFGSRRLVTNMARTVGATLEGFFGECQSSITVPVSAGTHTIELLYDDAFATDVHPSTGSLSAIYIPFNGLGMRP